MIALRYRGRHHRAGAVDRVIQAVAARFRPAPLRVEPVRPQGLPGTPGLARGVPLDGFGSRPDPDDAAVRFAGGDRGAFTMEFAAALPALMLLLSFGLTAVSAAADKGRCYDAAREAALAAARGESGADAGSAAAPPGATVELFAEGDQVRAVVSVPVRGLGVSIPELRATGEAVAAVEPGVTAATG